MSYSRFQPGEGPSRGLLRDYEPSDAPFSSSSPHGIHVRGVQGLPEAHQAEQPPPLLPPEVPTDGAEEEDQPDADHRHHHLLRVLGPAQPLQHSPRYLRAIRQHRAGRHVCDV